MRHPPVVITQPVHQHGYETAVAAWRAGLLATFLTGFYLTGRDLSRPSVLRAMPKSYERLFRRRWHPDLDPAHVTTLARYHALGFAYRKIAERVGLDPYRVEAWAHERFDRAAAARLRRWWPRIVHAFEGSALDTLREARRLGAVAVLDVPAAREYYHRVLDEEGGDPAELRLPRIRAEREVADVLVVPSEFVEACLLEHGIEPSRIVRIPYAADPTGFAPGERRNGRFRVLFVGHIGLRKGANYLLEAWRRLELRDAELLLVGSADEHGREMMRRHEGLFRWVGQVPKYEVHRWYRESDVFVFPTLAEGSAYVSYEAMAAGLPVVTTPCCGSVVRDGVDGYIVAPRDVDALSARIAQLYEDRALCAEMGASARGLIVSSYTWSHYHERIAALYRRLLEGGVDGH